MFAIFAIAFTADGKGLITCGPNPSFGSSRFPAVVQTASRQAGKQASKQASKQAGKQAGKQASKQASRQASRQAGAPGAPLHSHHRHSQEDHGRCGTDRGVSGALM